MTSPSNQISEKDISPITWWTCGILALILTLCTIFIILPHMHEAGKTTIHQPKANQTKQLR